MPSLSCDKWYQRQKAVVCPSNTRLPCSGSLCLPLKQQKFHNLRRFIFSRFLFYLRSLTTKFHWSCGGGDFLLYSKTDKNNSLKMFTKLTLHGRAGFGQCFLALRDQLALHELPSAWIFQGACVGAGTVSLGRSTKEQALKGSRARKEILRIISH